MFSGSAVSLHVTNQGVLPNNELNLWLRQFTVTLVGEGIMTLNGLSLTW